MHGVVPILITPFDAADCIDEEGLRSVIDYNIDAGVHGLGVAFATETPKLTETERDQVTRIVVEQARGRVPVVVNTGAPSTHATVAYSMRAADLGASAVMATPPACPERVIKEYFGAMCDAVQIPVFVQEVSGIVGGGLLRQLAEENDNLRYAKIESAPSPQKILDAVEACAGRVTVLGGSSGSQLIEELRRGSQGTMPWPSLPHAFVQVWDLWQAGDEIAARQTWEQQIQPVLRLGGVVHKQILYRQGVIADPRFRAPDATAPLDEATQREFDEVCERLGIG
jgi:dihydrodipicolinate synthase/N-acetylneuraminate lyase